MDESSLIAIRLKLQGFREAAAQAKSTATSMSGLGTAADRAGTRARVGLDRAAGAMATLGRNARAMRDHGRSMTYGMTLPLGLLGAAALNAASDFEVSMAQVSVATGQPKAEMDGLRQLAMDLGDSSMYSANEVASAMVELGKSGITARQIQGGALDSTVTLAAADGQMTLAEAAMQASSAMGAFGLAARDSGRITTALAGGANASQANVRDLGMALQQAATVAAASGLSINETTGALSAFAKAGIAGSDAGTSLKTFLQRLNPQTDKARDLMSRLGLSFYDSRGEMVGMTQIAGRMREAFRGMTDQQRNSAMQTLFGSDAVRAANVLYAQGAGGIADYIGATRDEAKATEMAKANMEGTRGAIERAKGALENMGIVVGQELAPTIEWLASKIEAAARWFGDLSPGAQKAAVALAGVGIAIGPLVFIAGSLITAIKGIGIALAFLGKNPIVLIIAGVALLVAALIDAYHRSETFRNVVDSVARALGNAFIWMRNAVKNAITWVREAVGNVIEFLGNVWDKIKGPVSVVKDFLVAPFRAAFGVIKGIIEGVVDTVVWIVDKVKWAVGKLDELNGSSEWMGPVLDAAKDAQRREGSIDGTGVMPTDRSGRKGSGRSSSGDEPALGGNRRKRTSRAAAASSPEAIFDFDTMRRGDGMPAIINLDGRRIAEAVLRHGETAEARA